MSKQSCNLPLIMLGAGGHAKVLLSLTKSLGRVIHGVCDPQLLRSGHTEWRGLVVLGDDSALSEYAPESILVVNGIGQTVSSVARRRAYEHVVAHGYRFATLVHPAAWVDPSATLEDGVQVMAGAIVQADAVVGANTIINTGASVDHDCVLGMHSHIAPGATLCGSVRVADRCFIASGATVIQGVSIGEDAVVGAGAVLVRDLSAHGIVLGSKARFGIMPGK